MTNLTELEEAHMPDQPEDAEEPAEAAELNDPEKADEFEYSPPDNGDDQLRALVDLINTQDLTVDVTLHLGGGLVSGTLVSIKTYTAGIAETVRAADADSPLNDAVAQFFEAWAGEWKGDDLEDEHPDEWMNTRHVHLRDAVVREPSGQGGLQTPWWRGRIGAVSGWTLGTWDEPPAGHLTFGV